MESVGRNKKKTDREERAERRREGKRCSGEKWRKRECLREATIMGNLLTLAPTSNGLYDNRVNNIALQQAS